MNNIKLTVEEEAPIELAYVEAKIKPEQVRRVVPTYEGLSVVPDYGNVLSRVDIDPIPDPTEIANVFYNGDYNVARIGTVHVAVNTIPVLLNEVDISNLPEHVNRITFDIDSIDLSNYRIVWVESDGLELSGRDYLYFDIGEKTCLLSTSQTVFDVNKVLYVKTDAWHNVIRAANVRAYPNAGDYTDVSNIAIYPYVSTTTFVDGVVKLYAL